VHRYWDFNFKSGLGKGAIAHELTHLITAQMTLNPYNDIPTWLDEGLAMYNQGPLDSTFVTNLNLAIQKTGWLPCVVYQSVLFLFSDILCRLRGKLTASLVI